MLFFFMNTNVIKDYKLNKKNIRMMYKIVKAKKKKAYVFNF
jgi:hypothetical protein